MPRRARRPLDLQAANVTAGCDGMSLHATVCNGVRWRKTRWNPNNIFRLFSKSDAAHFAAALDGPTESAFTERVFTLNPNTSGSSCVEEIPFWDCSPESSNFRRCAPPLSLSMYFVHGTNPRCPDHIRRTSPRLVKDAIPAALR